MTEADQERTERPDPAVEATGMTVVFGDRVAFRASNFVIPSGAITAVIGPNASGKSTVLNAISGLVPLADGTLTVLGHTPHHARRKVAHVLQSTKVSDRLPITVREVVTMSRYAERGAFGPLRKNDRDQVDRALEDLDIQDLAGRHLGELSGGQQQRVFVAQGLAQGAELLLLDEPLNALDIPSKERISRAIFEARDRGITVVATTHDLGEATQADHVLLLSGGVTGQGKPKELLTPENLAVAYGLVAVEGSMVIDDSAHFPTDERHVHFDRTGHLDH